MALGMKGDVHISQAIERPEGCYYADDALQELYLNVNPMNTGRGAETSGAVPWVPLCASPAPPRSSLLRGQPPAYGGATAPAAASRAAARGGGAGFLPWHLPWPFRLTWRLPWSRQSAPAVPTTPTSTSTAASQAAAAPSSEVSTTELQPPPAEPPLVRPAFRTMYMYRAQSDAEYPPLNVNTADLTGLLWYLHNEVMTMCPRKYGITRVMRLKVTAWNDFMPFVAFDSGKCTVPGCEALWAERGFAVGCQNVAYGANLTVGRPGLAGHWYSLPGPCPLQPVGQKSQACMEASPGGSCRDVTGARDCNFHVEHAGEVRLDEVTGIQDYSAFCAAGRVEYDKLTDRGSGFSFWDGKTDPARTIWRYNSFIRAFQLKYPDMPADLGWSAC